jgi:hypothetical protein
MKDQTKTTKTEEVKPNKVAITTPIADGFKTVLRLVDANIMPILAWVALVGLAVRGSMTLLAHMTPNAQLAIAIAIVAFLAFKLK